MITGAKLGRTVVLVTLVLVYAAYIAALGGLAFPLTGDETHFWQTAVDFFGRTPLPTVAALHSYSELNTPLPFVVWGTLEYWFHQGLWLPRALNLALSVLLAVRIVASRPPAWHSIAAGIGLLVCPYYLFVSAHIYTDMLAVFCAAFGVAAYADERFAASAVLFVLGIATRQYIVGFPLGILVYEVARRDGRRSTRAVVAAAIAAASLAGWVLFFGGIAPPAAIAFQGIATASAAAVIPQNTLYFLSCVGLYFTLPYALLVARQAFRRPWPLRKVFATAAALVVLFALFPPVGNLTVPTVEMGLLDRMLHALHLAAPARVLVLCAFAAAAVLSLLGNPLALSLTIANAAVMLKGHLAWDKYALPLLAALWLLTARGPCDSSGDDGLAP